MTGVKNVTIALDDEVHRLARIRAAEMGTSLSALVKDYLNGLAAGSVALGVSEMPMSFASESATAPKLPPRRLGQMKGEIWLADDWDKWSEEELTSFEAWPFDNPEHPST
ncbi:MAG: hypothetical protein RLZZ366_1648 [Pseudomonadota bacterium]